MLSVLYFSSLANVQPELPYRLRKWVTGTSAMRSNLRNHLHEADQMPRSELKGPHRHCIEDLESTAEVPHFAVRRLGA